jgi:16S rRNA (cytidine1402-2'-O)-methyltransferase
VIPGPSVVETALVASGYAGSSYRFAGFVPRRPAELRTFWETLSSTPEPVVAFESPRRLAASLAALAAVAPGRELAVCRELTKHYESVVRGPVEQILVGLPDPVRGEVTLVIAPAPAAEARGVDVDALARGIEAVGTLRGAGAKRSVAVAVVAALTGLPRNRLYDDSL